MAVTVASWNVLRGLGDTERSPGIIEGIKRLDTDIVVISEAYADGTVFGKQATGMADPSSFNEFAKSAGYAVLHTPYEDVRPREYEQHLVVLSRLGTMAVTRLVTRNGITVNLTDPETGLPMRGYGAHFEDRSEYVRRMMAHGLTQDVTAPQNGDLLGRSFILGDLNALHPDTMRARLLRGPVTAKAVDTAGWLATKIGTERGMGKKIDRIHSLTSRLHGMAEGETMLHLTQAGYRDADPKQRPTMKLGPLPFVQLDHILANTDIRVEEFQHHPGKGSDHKAISAKLIVDEA